MSKKRRDERRGAQCASGARFRADLSRQARLARKAGLKGSFVGFRDKLSTLWLQFVYKSNPPVALRAPAPFTQGGLVAKHHSFAVPDNLLSPASYIICGTHTG